MNGVISQNILINVTPETSEKYLFQVALKFAKQSKYVLYIKPTQFKTIPERQIPDKETLKRIFFVYTTSKRKIIAKLLEINNWNMTPAIIIYESINQFFDSSNETLTEQYSFFISFIHSIVDVFSKKRNQKCLSIISIDQNRSFKVFKVQQILIELYFYKKDCFLEGEDVPRKLNQILFVKNSF